MTATHFATAASFRRWLARHHATANELIVSFFTKNSRRSGLTYPEALNEALCFGWIDGIRRKSELECYTIRFTPRRPDSIWSNLNVRHAVRLTAAGKMNAAGHRAFEARRANKTGIYSFEKRPRKFPTALEKGFRANTPAWHFWQAQPPGYQRTAIWWVISAKLPETRQRRLRKLIALSSVGRRLV